MLNKLESGKQNKLIGHFSIVSSLIYLVITVSIFLFSAESSAYSKSATSVQNSQSTDLELNQQEKDSLIYLLKQDCGSCHGLTLQGGLGPALLKKNLTDKPASYLESVITYGRPGTPMPPWGNILSQSQIKYLAEYLLSDVNTLLAQQSTNEAVITQKK